MSVMEAAAEAEDFTDADRERLEELERTIATALDHYVRVGRALDEIHQRRLYRATHRSFKAYLRERWNLSLARGSQLRYTAHVAGVLEDAGERPEGSNAALREFSPVLHAKGPEATVAAFRVVAEDGVLPSAPKTREKLIAQGLADRPRRDAADLLSKRLVAIERYAGAIKPHPKLAPLLAGYAFRLRAVADQLEAVAGGARPPVVGEQPPPRVAPDELCVGHGARRGTDGLCVACQRPDVAPSRR